MLNSSETHNGLPVFRGRLTRRNKTYPDEAILRIPCDRCGWHQHGWDLRDGFDVLSRRASHCVGHYEHGYFIGLDRFADHAVPIKRRTRRNRLKE